MSSATSSSTSSSSTSSSSTSQFEIQPTVGSTSRPAGKTVPDRPLTSSVELPTSTPTQSFESFETASTSVQATSIDSPSAANTIASESATTSVSSSSGAGLSTAAKIGLGVGLGAGIPLLLALAGCFIFGRRRKRNRIAAGGKYTQGASDVSMVESPVPGPISESRQVPEMEFYGPPKAFEPATYHAFGPSQDYEHYETPVSAVTPLEPHGERSLLASPPPLVIPAAESRPHSSMEPPTEREVSPVSPVSPMSAVSSLGSRPPSPTQHGH